MKRYLKVLMLILTASFFVLACQDTSDSSNGSNGSNSGIEDGGSGGNGDGGGSSLDSEIINATMRVSADENDALKNTFFSPAVATNGGKLQYTWNFGDDTESIDTDYNYVTHQFNKYGKTYTIKLLLNNMSSSQQETVTMDLSLPKPELSINCNTSGALIFCNPVISQQAIQDVSYTWNIFNSDGTLEKEILSTGSQIINHRVADSGTYKIVLKGTSTQVDGEMTAERDIYVSVNISQGQITYNNTSSDMLSYKYTFNAQAIDGSQLEYCWDFDGTAKCSEGAGFQLGAQHSVADHTYSKYNAANTVTAFARIPGTNEVVSNSVIVQQALPEVSIKAEGTGLVRKLSPVFSFRPKGNISYIWKTGDGKEYSQETVNHTYIKNGTYTAELTVLNDLFAPEIGAVSAKPLNIYAYGNIQNVVIEYSKVNQTNQGETYTFSSPATSDTGKLYFTWKINNEVVAEGEGLSSINHTFTKYGQNASVSLELKLIGSNEIISAEPVLVQTSKPTAVLNPPANITVNVPVEFKGEILSHLNGTDFTSNLINPQYKLEISNVEFKYSDTLTIPYTFIEKGTYSAKLVVTADNIEGSIISEPVTVQANEALIVCRNETNPADIYSVKVICQTENVSDTTLKYSLTYQEYINDVYTTKEYGAEDIAEIILYHREKDGIYNNDIRNIIVNWEIYKDKANSENIGTYQYKNIVQEPAMGQIVDVLMKSEESSSGIGDFSIFYYDKSTQSFIENGNINYTAKYVPSTYALDSNGRVYSWGNLAGGQYNITSPQYTPKLINLINGKTVKMWNDMHIDVFQREDGELFISYILNSSRLSWFVHLKGMKNKQIKFLPLNYISTDYDHKFYFITSDGGLYYIDFTNYISESNYVYSGSITPEQVEISGNVKKILADRIKMYIITDTNKFYIISWLYSELQHTPQKLADDVEDFADPVTPYNKIFAVRKTDGNLYNIPDYYDNLLVNKDPELESINTYSGKNILYNDPIYSSTTGGTYNFIKGEDNKLYSNFTKPGVTDDRLDKCSAGIGNNLPAEEYSKIQPLDIPEEVLWIYGDGNYGKNAVTVSGKVYTWGASQCTPQLVPGLEITSNIKERKGNIILLENGKIYDMRHKKYIDIPDNPIVIKIYADIDDDISISTSDFLYAYTDTGELYSINTSYEDNNLVYKVYKIENFKYNNIKVFFRSNQDIFVTESGGFSIVSVYGDMGKLLSRSAKTIQGLPANIKYIQTGLDLYAHTEDNRLYEIKCSYLEECSATLIDVPVYKKHYGPERNASLSSNNGRSFYSVFTDDGSIYSWGAVEGTGTYEQENITIDGFVTKPTKVNK